VADGDAIALRSGGRREKRRRKYEQMPEVKDAPSNGRRRDRVSRCHLRSLWVWVWCCRLD
jgi:hypothetical protein